MGGAEGAGLGALSEGEGVSLALAPERVGEGDAVPDAVPVGTTEGGGMGVAIAVGEGVGAVEGRRRARGRGACARRAEALAEGLPLAVVEGVREGEGVPAPVGEGVGEPVGEGVAEPVGEGVEAPLGGGSGVPDAVAMT